MAICVVGGSSGIGRAIAERFAANGNPVFINYHADDAAAQESAAAVEARGGQPHLIKADVGNPAGIAQLMGAVRERVTSLDQLVHAAAFAAPGPLLEQDWEILTSAVAVNGLGLIAVVREALPLLPAGSSVVYLTSNGSQRVIRNYGALGISKALGEHIVRYLAVELGRRDVSINAVSPGPLDTAAFRKMFPTAWEPMLAAAARSNPAGRGLEFVDVTDVVEMITRPEFRMVRGQVITIDGGLSLAL
jgi:enoyl-[acyl-carrier protein] reductase III